MSVGGRSVHVVCSYIDGVFVVVHDSLPPSDGEWNALLDEILRYAEEARLEGRPPRGALILSYGGAPNARQRKRLASVTAKTGLAATPKAVVTTSALVRGAVTALNWLGSQMRAFVPDELAPALEYLGIPDAHRARLLAEVARLRAELSQPVVRLRGA